MLACGSGRRSIGWDVERNGQPASVITIASVALNPAHPRAPRFRRVSAKAVVGSGANRLELYPVRGETGERMMAVYMPQHRILYGSDLVQWGCGGPPEYVSELVDLAAPEKLAVDTVYAMHADPSPWSKVLSAVAGDRAQ